MIRVLAITHENEKITDLTMDNVDFSLYKWWWIDFQHPSMEEVKELQTKLHFHPLAVEDCIHSMQRPKLDYYDHYAFIATHTIGPEAFNQHEIDFFIGNHFIVTFHHETLSEVSRVWNNLPEANEIHMWDEFKVFYEIMDNVVDNYFPIVYQLEDQINDVEDNPNNLSMNIQLDTLFALRHKLLELRHTINPIRDLFYRILNSRHLKNLIEHREYFADLYDHLLKLSEMVNSNREITNDIRDNFISYNSYQQNKVIQILTVITSIFAPLTFIAGIYGMNFVNMPELEWHYGYFIVMAVMFTLSVLMILWLKRKGWFR